MFPTSEILQKLRRTSLWISPYRGDMHGVLHFTAVSSYRWKPRFQNFLRPWANVLARAGITANMLTVAALALSMGAGVLLSRFADRPVLFLLMPPALLLRMALNAMDGMLAREHGQASPLGAYLNELGDVVSDAFLFLPFAFVPGIHPGGIAVAVLLIALTEMAGVLAAAQHCPRRYEGPFGKSDRALFLGATALWVGVAGPFPPLVAAAFAPLLWLLLGVTLVNRVRRDISMKGK